MAEIIHLRRDHEREFLELRNIFENEFSGHPTIQEMYLNPQEYIERTVAYKEFGKILGGLKRGYNPDFDALTLDFLAVDEESRGRGIGGQLLANLEEFAVARGISQIRLKPRNSWQATSFYKKNGYQFDRGILHRDWMVKNL